MWYKISKLEDKIKKVIKKYPGNGIRAWILSNPKIIFISFGDWADDVGKIIKEIKLIAGGSYKIEHDFEVLKPDSRKWKKVSQTNKIYGGWISPNGDFLPLTGILGHIDILHQLKIKNYREAFDKGYVRITIQNNELFVNSDNVKMNASQIKTINKISREIGLTSFVSDYGDGYTTFNDPKKFQSYLRSIKASLNNKIDISLFQKSLKDRLLSIVSFSEQSKEENAKFKFNWHKVESILRKYNFPWQYLNQLEKDVKTKNEKNLIEAQRVISRWVYKEEFKTPNMDNNSIMNARFELQTVISDIRNFCNQIYDTSVQYRPYTKNDADKDFESLSQQTMINMQKISDHINQTISKIENWNGSGISIIADEIYKENDIEASDSAMIAVGDNGEMTPYFTLFEIKNGSAVIDDVLEAGDEDFFPNNSIQSDYFNLIQELRNPGSSSKGGKLLTLYTARPVKDRNIYMNATEIPSNIFLTNSYSSAVGIASDLGGSKEVRDVWKVVIDSKYLLQTLDGPEKQYQAIGRDSNKVPIKRIVLEHTGESARA